MGKSLTLSELHFPQLYSGVIMEPPPRAVVRNSSFEFPAQNLAHDDSAGNADFRHPSYGHQPLPAGPSESSCPLPHPSPLGTEGAGLLLPKQAIVRTRDSKEQSQGLAQKWPRPADTAYLSS